MENANIEHPGAAMVLYLFPPDYAGGANQAIELARELSINHITSFFIAANLRNAPERDKIAGLDVYRIKTKTSRLHYFLFALKTINLLFRLRKRYEVIHIHSLKPFFFLIRWFGSFIGKPAYVTMTCIGTDDPETLLNGSFLQRIEGRSLAKYDKVICMSHAQKELCLKHDLEDEKLAIIHCAVDMQRFFPVPFEEKSRLRKELGIPSDENTVVFLFIGRISIRKGCDLILEAWKRLLERYLDQLFLVMVGPYGIDDPFLDEEGQIFSRQLEDWLNNASDYRTLFTGLVEHSDLPKYYQLANSLLLPSREEGFPVSPLEAMACGLPVIASYIEGITNYSITEKTGIILEERTADQLETSMIKLLENHEQRKNMEEEAVNRIKQKFEFSGNARKHLEVYSSGTSIPRVYENNNMLKASV